MRLALVLDPAGLIAGAITLGLAFVVLVAIPDEHWEGIGLPILAGALAGVGIALAPSVSLIILDPPAAAPQADSPSPADGAPATATPAEQEASNAQD